MSHHHHHNEVSGNRLKLTIILNVGITVSQLIGGIISGSTALISDALHNFSDVISLVISYIANLLAHRKEQTLDKTFGYKRAEIVAALINSTTLIVLAIFLIYEAIIRFIHPKEIHGNTVIWLALLSIALNGLSVLLLKKDAKNSINMRSAYLHLFSDMLTSVAVLIGGLLIKYKHWYFVDPILTLLIAGYLLYMSWGLLQESLRIIMQFAPKEIEIADVEKEVTKIEGIKNIHHVHIWQLNDKSYHLEGHVEFNKDIKLSEFDKICEKIENVLLEKFKINHTNIQPEWHRDDPKEYIIPDH